MITRFPILLVASVLLAVAAHANTHDPQLQKVLHKHLDAMGGLANWNRVESIQLNGTIERDGQFVDLVIVKKRPNQIRATVTIPVPGKEDEFFQIIRAHDGKTAWTATRLAGQLDMTREVLPEEAAAKLLADAGVLPPLIKLWRGDADLKLLVSEVIDSQNYHTIRVTGEDFPSEYTFYLDAETYFVTQYETVHPTHGVTRTSLGDYTKTHNVLLPKRNEIQADQTGQSIMTTDSIKVGVGIYREYFEADNLRNTAKL